MPKLFSQFILPSPSPIVSSLFSMSMSFKCRVKYSQLLRLCSSKPSTWHLTPSLSWVFSALAGGSLDYFLFCAHSGIALLLLSRGTFPASWIRHMQVPISWWRQGGPQPACVCVFVRVCFSPVCAAVSCPVLCLQTLPPVPPWTLVSAPSLGGTDVSWNTLGSSELGKPWGSPCFFPVSSRSPVSSVSCSESKSCCCLYIWTVFLVT